ncbi:hypothetical protein [Flavobacterium sp.]|uniref:hypothetical protein n=1 Tax=Flavobacterium sp. TaxID=239 RepID=UPI00286C5082|nr:hypothetical protein [Flavobacterium sp.]
MSRQLSLNEKEILEQIRDATYETLTRGKDEKGIPFLKHIFELHYKIFGETCSNCPDKISGYIQKLKNFNPIKKMETTKTFQLKEGVIIPVAGTSDAYSNANLTDEIALKLLSDNPNRKILFEKLPENLDDLIDEGVEVNLDPEVLTFGEKTLTIEEALSLLEKINVISKATTVTGVLKKIDSLTAEQKIDFQTLVNDFVA